MSIGSFERYPLLFGPVAPCTRWNGLSAQLGGAPVWAKREGLQLRGSPTAVTRPASWSTLIARCPGQGLRHAGVDRRGAVQPQTRQVAAVAARAGLNCVLIQEKLGELGPIRSTTKSATSLISRLAGADVRAGARRIRHSASRRAGSRRCGRSRNRAAGPYAIPGRRLRPSPWRPGVSLAGRSSSPARNASSACSFDTIVGVLGEPASTQAGMVAGFAAQTASGGRPRRVIGNRCLSQAG